MRVIFTDDKNNPETLTSAATAAVSEAARPNSPATGAPSISGTVRVGETLTADPPTDIEDDDGLSRRGLQLPVACRRCGHVAGATSSTATRWWKPTLDKAIKVRVSFTDDKNNPEIADQRGYGGGGTEAEQPCHR